MADLSSDLQKSITDLQTQHTNLVQAIRDYRGGSLATATNDLLSAAEDVEKKIAAQESGFIGMLAANAKYPLPNIVLDFKNEVYLVGDGGGLKTVDPVDYLNLEEYSGNGSVIGSSGKVEPGPGAGLRYTHDPVTGEKQGVWVEGFSNNYILAQDFSSPFWSKEGSSVTQDNTVTPPISGLPVFKLVPTTDGVFRSLRIVSVPDGVVKDASYSIFMKAGNYGLMKMQVNLDSGSDDAGINVNLDNGSYNTYGSVRYAGAIDHGNGWWRVWMSVDGTPTSQCKMAWFQSTATQSDYVYVCGAQIENRYSPTSFIYLDAEGSTGTRNSDVFQILPSGEINSRQGTFVITLYPRAIHGNLWYIDTLHVDSSNSYDPFAIRTGGTAMANLYVPGLGNVPTPDATNGTYNLEHQNKVTVALGVDTNTGTVTAWVDGVMQETISDIPSYYQPMDMAKIGFGRWLSGGQFSSAIWEKIVYYPYMITLEQGQELTAP